MVRWCPVEQENVPSSEGILHGGSDTNQNRVRDSESHGFFSKIPDSQPRFQVPNKEIPTNSKTVCKNIRKYPELNRPSKEIIFRIRL